MRLGFEADNALYVTHFEVIARAVVLRSELLDDWSLSKRHIIFIGRNDVMGILLSRFLYHLEERRRFFLAIYDKCSAKDLVPAVFTINLSEAKDLAISKFPAKLSFHLMQVFYFFGGQREAFLLVVFLQILNADDGFRLLVDGKNILIQAVIKPLKHGVVVSILVLYGVVFLYSRNAFDGHVLRDFHRVGAPRRNHFAARSNEITLQVFFLFSIRFTIQPAEFLDFGFRESLFAFGCDNT